MWKLKTGDSGKDKPKWNRVEAGMSSMGVCTGEWVGSGARAVSGSGLMVESFESVSRPEMLGVETSKVTIEGF